MADSPPVFLLGGPTASGKTALALDLAGRFPVDIISVDAFQVYRGMDIGTAKPSPEELQCAPHRLIDIREPSEAWTAHDFVVAAHREIRSIMQRGRIPLLVGGTMFYFHALTEGLSELPGADNAIRARLRRELETDGVEALHARLARMDPQTAASTRLRDRVRVLRALEIAESTGMPPSLARAGAKVPKPPWTYVPISLWPVSRSRLHECIAQRLGVMLERGWIEEVRHLVASGALARGFPAMKAAGYEFLLDHLEGRMTQAAARERTLALTRQIAKRQTTWLRRWPEVTRVTNTGEEKGGALLERVSTLVAPHLSDCAL